MIPLGLLQPGEKGEVVEINPQAYGWGRGRGFGGGRGFGKGKGVLMQLLNMGIHKGTIVEVIQNPGFGPMLIKLNNSFQLALGRGIAMKILVKKIENSDKS